MKYLPLTLLVACAPVPFAAQSVCNLDAYGTVYNEVAKPHCEWYQSEVADALGKFKALTGSSWDGSKVTVWIHNDYPGILCQGNLSSTGEAAGCTYPVSDGFYIETTLGAGELLHEMLHVYQMQNGMSEGDTAKHPDWFKDGWWQAGETFQVKYDNCLHCKEAPLYEN